MKIEATDGRYICDFKGCDNSVPLTEAKRKNWVAFTCSVIEAAGNFGIIHLCDTHNWGSQLRLRGER